MDAVGKLVSARLNGRSPESHPDPETLTAFAEGCLTGADRHNALLHLAACAQCREVLFMVTPPVEVQPTYSLARKHPRWSVRWATLAASLIIIGSVIFSNRGVLTRHSVQKQETVPGSPTVQVAADKAPANSEQPASSAEQELKARPPVKHMTAKPQASMRFDQSGEVHFAAAPSATVSAKTEAEAKNESDASGSYVWDVTSRGVVQRSSDSGKTWQSLPIAVGASFLVVSSVGSEVWAGGRTGTLYHSANSGETWTKLEPTIAGKKLESDITQIRLSDRLHGSVNTADGQVWSTSDGGKNWQLQ